MIDVGRSRNYLYGPEISHVLGYVAPVAEDDEDKDPLLKLPGFGLAAPGLRKFMISAYVARAEVLRLRSMLMAA